MICKHTKTLQRYYVLKDTKICSSAIKIFWEWKSRTLKDYFQFFPYKNTVFNITVAMLSKLHITAWILLSYEEIGISVYLWNPLGIIMTYSPESSAARKLRKKEELYLASKMPMEESRLFWYSMWVLWYCTLLERSKGHQLCFWAHSWMCVLGVPGANQLAQSLPGW